MKKLFKIAAAGLLAVCGAGAASAQATFGPLQTSSNGNGVITTTIAVPAGSTGDQGISIDYAGDLGFSSEFLTVTVEGTTVATLLGELNNIPGDCVMVYSQTVNILDSVFTAAAADGSVDITFTATSRVNSLCGTGNIPYTGPFASIASPSAFAVQGTASFGTAPAPSSDPIATVAAARGLLVLQHAPDVQGRIDRLKGSAQTSRNISFAGNSLIADVPFDLALGETSLSFASSGAEIGGFTFWTEGTIVGLSDDASSGQTFGIIHFGADTTLATNTLVGFGVQLDQLSSTEIASGDKYKGTGWMIGPYMTHRFSESLFLDARLAAGQVDTDVTRSGGVVDSYSSDRALAQISLVGSTRLGEFDFAPRAEANYYLEESDAFTSATLGAVAATKVEVKQAELGGRLSQTQDYAGGQVTPFFDLAAIYSEVSSNTALTNSSFASGLEGWSAQVGFGASFTADNGMNWAVDVNYTGTSKAEAIGITAFFEIPF